MFDNKFGVIFIWLLNGIGATLGYLDMEAMIRMLAFGSAAILSIIGIIQKIRDKNNITNAAYEAKELLLKAALEAKELILQATIEAQKTNKKDEEK